MTSPAGRRRLRLGILVAVVLLLGGCMRGCASSRPPIHLNPNMDNQPKVRAQSASDIFYDGASMRPPVEGTVARGELNEDTVFHQGKDAGGAWASNPLTVDDAVLSRGAERYGIYCTACHGDSGDGRGMLYDRSQIESGDFHEQRLVDMADGEIFATITHGLGLMQGYAYQIPPRDRWAIIAYVRELQQTER